MIPNEVRRRWSSPSEPLRCRTHRRDKIIMVCEGCNHVFVCVNCLATEHKGHKCIIFADYLKTRKASVKELEQDVSAKCEDIEERLKSASECKDENKVKKESIINKIKTKGEEMKQRVNDWINENVDKCEELYQENENSIEKVNRACYDHINVLESDLMKCHETSIPLTHQEFQRLKDSLVTNISKSVEEIEDLGEVELLQGDREGCSIPRLLGILKIIKGCEMEEYKLLKKCIDNNSVLKIQEKIGGKTWKGTFGHVDAAIRIYNPNGSKTDRESFAEEVSILESLTHINVVRLFHSHTSADPVYMVLEYMADRDLHSYLRFTDYEIPLDKLVDFAAQVARGMEYVSSKGIIHRSIIASNILVDADPNMLKISDFAKAVRLEDGADTWKSCRGDINNYPIKWTAIESLRRGIFSTKTDVWSFGVLLWEIMTLGSLPYAEMENFEVIEHVESGKTLSFPRFCPKPIYDIMLKCWSTAPERRPRFEILHTLLTNFNYMNRTGQLYFTFQQTYPPRRVRRRRRTRFFTQNS